jgi:hypothetical protein
MCASACVRPRSTKVLTKGLELWLTARPFLLTMFVSILLTTLGELGSRTLRKRLQVLFATHVHKVLHCRMDATNAEYIVNEDG